MDRAKTSGKNPVLSTLSHCRKGHHSGEPQRDYQENRPPIIFLPYFKTEKLCYVHTRGDKQIICSRFIAGCIAENGFFRLNIQIRT